MEQAQSVLQDNTPSPIEEPPLKNSRSCLRRFFVFLLTLSILIIVIFSLINIFFGGRTVKRLAQLPANFPSDIPLNRFGDRSVIRYQSTKEDDRLLNRLSQASKYVSGPLILRLKPDLPPEEKILRNQVPLSPRLNWEELKKILAPSNMKNTDTIEIGWENLDEDSKNLYNSYKRNLIAQDYKIISDTKTKEKFELAFKKNNIEGNLIAEFEKKEEIKKLILKISFPSAAE